MRLVLVLCTACGRLGFDPLDASKRDGATVDTCASFGPWGEPQRLEALASGVEDWSPALSNDGLEIIFQRDNNMMADLYRSVRTSAAVPFPAASALANVNSSAHDGAPWLSSDRLRLYFSSDRGGSSRIYRAVRTSPDGDFSTPQLLPGLESVEARGPGLSDAEDELLFNDNTEDTIFRATLGGGVFTVDGALTELGTNQSSYADLSQDGRTVAFGSGGTGDLYTATRSAPGASFAPRTAITVLNSSSDEADPDFGDGDRALVFASNRGGVLEDMYIATRACN